MKIDPPEAPGKPAVDDYGVDFAELKWEAPEKDGGRPITHYVVEFKNKFLTDWTECAKTETSDPVCKVHGLKEKVVYQFRVRAVNKGGASKASEPSDNHTVKHKNRKFASLERYCSFIFLVISCQYKSIRVLL